MVIFVSKDTKSHLCPLFFIKSVSSYIPIASVAWRFFLSLPFLIDIWELERFKYFWPTEAEKEAGLFKDFTIEEYNRQRGETPVKYGVFIQVLNHSPEEAGKA